MRRAFCCAMVIALLAVPSALPAGDDQLEYRVKAAFLFNFLKFVEWPDAPGDGASWIIGVVGAEPLGIALEETVRGKSVAGKAVEIRRFPHLAGAKDCHILFISRG